MTTPPGWYRDPSNLWEFRWWDGTVWSEQVATGAFRSIEAYPPVLQPPADPATLLWSASVTSENEPVRLDLTWWTLNFLPERRMHEARAWPVGFIATVAVERAAPDGSGDLRLTLRGPGYVGPNTFLFRHVAQAHHARAVILRQRSIITNQPIA